MNITLNSRLKSSVANQATPVADQRVVAFGRSFQASFNELSSAQRSQLRYNQPTVQQSFWDCALKASRASDLPAFGIPMLGDLEMVTEALIPIMDLRHMRNRVSTNGQNIGAVLRGKSIAQRRIDSLFSESSLKGFLDNLEQVLRITSANVDIGVLMQGLCLFVRQPVEAKRVWARSYFTSQSSV